MTKRQFIAAIFGTIAFFLILGAFGALELDNISFAVFYRQCGIGAGLMVIAYLIGRE